MSLLFGDVGLDDPKHDNPDGKKNQRENKWDQLNREYSKAFKLQAKEEILKKGEKEEILKKGEKKISPAQSP